jgi:hypothetical protein
MVTMMSWVKDYILQELAMKKARQVCGLCARQPIVKFYNVTGQVYDDEMILNNREEEWVCDYDQCDVCKWEARGELGKREQSGERKNGTGVSRSDLYIRRESDFFQVP